MKNKKGQIKNKLLKNSIKLISPLILKSTEYLKFERKLISLFVNCGYLKKFLRSYLLEFSNDL